MKLAALLVVAGLGLCGWAAYGAFSEVHSAVDACGSIISPADPDGPFSGVQDRLNAQSLCDDARSQRTTGVTLAFLGGLLSLGCGAYVAAREHRAGTAPPAMHP